MTLTSARTLLKQVPGWKLRGRKIEREFEFKNFKEAMLFVNAVAFIAESQGHHPDFHIHYNKVKLELYTHAINGLHGSDFILAAKTNKLVE